MAIKYVTIGSLRHIHEYDDTDFNASIETDHYIKCHAAPVSDEDVLRKVDVGISIGDVVGPVVSTDNAIVRFDTITGKLLQNSLATIDDAGSITLLNGQTINGMNIYPITAIADYTIPTGYSFVGGDEFILDGDTTLSIEGTGRMILVG